jgi:hypothetical protein
MIFCGGLEFLPDRGFGDGFAEKMLGHVFSGPCAIFRASQQRRTARFLEFPRTVPVAAFSPKQRLTTARVASRLWRLWRWWWLALVAAPCVAVARACKAPASIRREA